MIETTDKIKQQRDWLQANKLTKEDLNKMILRKLALGKLQSMAVRKKK